MMIHHDIRVEGKNDGNDGYFRKNNFQGNRGRGHGRGRGCSRGQWND